MIFQTSISFHSEPDALEQVADPALRSGVECTPESPRKLKWIVCISFIMLLDAENGRGMEQGT